jgi:hypothetical protein
MIKKGAERILKYKDLNRNSVHKAQNQGATKKNQLYWALHTCFGKY